MTSVIVNKYNISLAVGERVNILFTTTFIYHLNSWIAYDDY